MGGAIDRLAQTEAGQQTLETPPVLGKVDRVGRGPENRHLSSFQRGGKLERGLAAELHDNSEQRAAAPLDPHDLDHVLGGKRLEIEAVGGVVIRRDGLRITVHHDRLDVSFAQAISGMHAAVIEFDPLADAVRSAPENDHLATIARVGFTLRRLEAVALVTRVHV
jgi:hypothetical protein